VIVAFAGENRTDLDFVNTGGFDLSAPTSSISWFALTMAFARERVRHVDSGCPAENTLGKRTIISAPLMTADGDAVFRLAVFLRDDRVLRDVDQTACQVTRVRGLQTPYRPDPYGHRASS
jgi:hypothetical protein